MTRSELLGLDRVDDHMPDGWQIGREGGGNIIAHAIDLKALPFPMEIVVMGDGGITCLGNELGEGKAQRQIDGDRQGILDNENFQVEAAGEFVQLFLEISL